ncbi:MAG: hypothetical protein J7507_05655 [Pseudoxanthomonas sp.]|nr:hypothetical protein [Pseudoxanthomonas sp.]
MRSMMIAALLAFTWPSPAHAFRPLVQTHTSAVQPGQLIQGIAFPPGTLVTIADPTGEVWDIELVSDARLQGRVFRKGTRIYLHPTGRIGSVFTVANQSIDGIAFGGDAQVVFDGGGDLEQAHIGRDTRIGKATYAGNTWVQFHPNGRVKEGDLVRPLNDGPLHVGPGTVAFWPNGRIQHARLEKAATINGIDCQAGDIALFPSGHIVRCAGADAYNRKLYACAGGRTLHALYLADQNVEIDYRFLMDRLPSQGGQLLYANSEMEWRPPTNDAPDSAGTLIERVPGEKTPKKTECRFSADRR